MLKHLKKRLEHFSLHTFFRTHAALICIALFIPKVFKIYARPFDSSYLNGLAGIINDLGLFIALNYALYYLCFWLKPRSRKILLVTWGFLLGILLFVSVVDCRFFLSTGSTIQWSLLVHGLRYFRQLRPILASEANIVWWALLPLCLFVGFEFAYWGKLLGEKTLPEKSFKPKKLALGLSLSIMFLILWPLVLEAVAQHDPLVRNLYLSLARDAIGSFKVKSSSNNLTSATNHLFTPIKFDASQKSERFNIVIIAVESLRADATNLYNPDKADTTPFLKTLAQEGLLVERGYTMIPHTTKSLVPIFCGYPPRISQALSETIIGGLPGPCLPSLLHPLGYRSGFFQPADENFENRRSLIHNMQFQDFVGYKDIMKAGFEQPNYLGIEERALIPSIMDWIDRGTQPFLIGVMTLLSHHDYKVPNRFSKKSYGGPEYWSDYLNTIRYTDQFINELFHEFEKRKLIDNTLFVFLGDHGEGFNEHTFRGHDNVIYEEGVHVAWVMYNRRLFPKPMVVKGLRQNIDLLPTLIDALKLKVTQGEPWGLSLLEPEEKVRERTLYFSCWWKDSCLGSLQKNEKFIYQYNRRASELYDLATDPSETVNRIATLTPEDISQREKSTLAWENEINSFYELSSWMGTSAYGSTTKPRMAHSINVRVLDHLEIVGYDMPKSVKLDENFKIVLAFKVLTPLNWYWKPVFTFIDGSGTKWPVQLSSVIDTEAPMYTWTPGLYFKIAFSGKIDDSRLFRDMTKGKVQISLGFKQYQTERVSMKGANLNSQNNEVVFPFTLAGS